MAILWFVLFSVNALCTSMVAALTGSSWVLLDNQSRLMIVIAIIGNWTGTVMAFISKQSTRFSQGSTPPVNEPTNFTQPTTTPSKP